MITDVKLLNKTSMAKLHLSQPGMNFSLSVAPEVLAEYLKTDVSKMDVSQQLAHLNKIKMELKEHECK